MREKAVALQYQDVGELPSVIASGVGEVARQIMQMASEYGVPVKKDEVLTEMLSRLNVGSVISPESYRLVAEVICFLYQTDLEFQKEHPDLKEALEKP